MKHFRSQKIVRAVEIAAAERNTADGPWRVAGTDGKVYDAPNNLFARGLPDPLEGYLVQYGDGYLSWSPKAAFEEGYREFGAGLSFGDALVALKSGLRVARAGWNGKGMWLALSGPLEGREIPAWSFWSPANRAYAETLPNMNATVLPCITMKTADGSILMGWLASQTDMLAEDWEIVP